MPRRAAAGTVRTFVALSMVIVTSAVMPARTAAGTFASATVTAYDTTPPGACCPTAVGAIAVTVPSTVASTAAIETDARLPDRHRREVALDDVGRDLERRRRR